MVVSKDVRRGNACAALNDDDFDELEKIARFELGSNSLLVSATTAVADIVVGVVPDWVIGIIEKAITPILMATSDVVARTHLEDNQDTWAGWLSKSLSGEWFHKIAATVSGAIGGSAGLPTAIAEIGVSTGLILRSIQDVARSYGQDLSDPQTLVECVSVLGRGGPSKGDDESDVAYWTMRAGLKKAITPDLVLKVVNSETAQKAAASATMQKVLSSEAFKNILKRYSITNLEVFAEKAVPVFGAVFGAFTNYQFISYYQNMAHVVFRLKPIAEKYEEGQVEACYYRVVANARRRSSEKGAPSGKSDS